MKIAFKPPFSSIRERFFKFISLGLIHTVFPRTSLYALFNTGSLNPTKEVGFKDPV
ncbi:hypothetical protein GCM10010912_56640 [Paenibacillus albidus]|uniref:Uncharacterized protein n=1 Tax=Paenibacillus albidus TaxID=2041023 RepID=A0A917D2N8_9BACL|nr:hypothetical protein GCM10010912_56640 [Paenibacillus albidus]